MPVETAEFTTMRVPVDVNQMVNVLATLDKKSVQEWNNTELREWIERKYQRRMQREANELGGEA